jgi:hypothetical protein
MVLNQEQVADIKQTVDKVVSHTICQAAKVDALDVASFVASEIIDLIEWMSGDIAYNATIAKYVLDAHDWPMGTGYYVKRHFGLPY